MQAGASLRAQREAALSASTRQWSLKKESGVEEHRNARWKERCRSWRSMVREREDMGWHAKCCGDSARREDA